MAYHVLTNAPDVEPLVPPAARERPVPRLDWQRRFFSIHSGFHMAADNLAAGLVGRELISRLI